MWEIISIQTQFCMLRKSVVFRLWPNISSRLSLVVSDMAYYTNNIMLCSITIVHLYTRRPAMIIVL